MTIISDDAFVRLFQKRFGLEPVDGWAGPDTIAMLDSLKPPTVDPVDASGIPDSYWPMLSKIENAQTSCSLSTLARLAAGLDVPVTTLLRGAESERPASYVAAGTGARIVRAGTKEGHEYELLGSLRGEHKRLECLLVTLTEQSETYPLFQHPGTEFIYVLEGTMDYRHSRTVYRLGAGDSLQLDGEGMHGPTALHDLQVETRLAHDALEALRKPVSPPRALPGHAGHDVLGGFILVGQ